MVCQNRTRAWPLARVARAIARGSIGVAAVTLAVSAEQAPQQVAQFRSGVDLVTLDLSAVRPDGTVVTDLRPNEVSVTIDGQPRTIRSFQFVGVAGKVGDRSSSVAPPPLYPLPAEASTSPRQDRIIYVVVFHEHIRQGNERQAMGGVARIIDQLGPADRVAIVTMPFGRVEVELTTDHARVKKRLPQIIGHSAASAPTGAQTSSEAQDLLAFLKSLVPLQGPKTIVLISEGFQNGDGLFPERVKPEWADALLLGEAASMQAEITDLRVAAATARAQFYALQPANLATDAAFKEPESEKLDRAAVRAMGENQTRALASFTSYVGGQFFQISGTATAVADRIVRETSGYYAIAFETMPADRQRSSGSVRVRTTRQGIVLRARRTFPDVNGGARPQPVTEVPSASRAPAKLGPRAGASGTRTTTDPSLEPVLDRMAQYVTAYGENASMFVAIEKYTQNLVIPAYNNLKPRQIVAEFAIVKAPGEIGWIGFRDVVEVDGRAVSDRRDRLMSILTNNSADASQATKLANESARFNVGPISRNFNTPTSTLFFFYPANLGRFVFTKRATGRIAGAEAWEVGFKETQMPTIVRTSTGKPVPIEGTLWVSPADGAVLKSRLVMRNFADQMTSSLEVGESIDLRRIDTLADIEVTYARNEQFGVWLPEKMTEMYTGPIVLEHGRPPVAGAATTKATYSDFKQFDASVKINVPK